MRKSRNVARCLLAVTPLLMPTLSIAPLNAQPELTDPPGVGVAHCEDYPYTVICKNQDAPGLSRDFCYDTLCEAVAHGAHSCKTCLCACEPD